MKLERGHVSFSIFAVLVGSLFLFMMSGMPQESGHAVYGNGTTINESINENVYRSFCSEYSDDERESGDHDYTGHCELYFGEIVSISGVVVGMEYIGENSVKYNINSKMYNSIKEGEDIRYKFDDGEYFTLKVNEILNSYKEEGLESTEFDYKLSKEKPQSFCEGVYCTIYLGDKLFIEDHEISLKKFCLDSKDCDLTMKIDGENYEETGLKEGSIRKFENLTLSFEELNTHDEYMRFKHNYRMRGAFCNDTDRGQDYFNKGTLRGFYEKENYTYGEGEIIPFTFTDYCYHFTPTLIEFYCNKDEYLVAERHECEGGCFNGTCLNLASKDFEESNESEKNNGSIEEKEKYVVENETSTNYIRDQEKRDLYVKKKENKSLFGKFFSWIGGLF